MDFFQAIALGLVQGASEFLPISSSGHLVLFPWFFGWDDPGLSFDVALHLGTLFAVISFFLKDFWKIISALFKKEVDSKDIYSKKHFWFIVLATIPGAMAGFFLNDYAEDFFRNPLFTAFGLIFFGWLLFFADNNRAGKKKVSEIKKMNFYQALKIGLFQALAIIPGVSRSGITITAGLFEGFSREESARFSFLLSGPIIFGAVIFKIPEFIEKGFSLYELVGILSATVSGFLAIKFLIKFISKFGYRYFFWYRLIIGLLILFFWSLRF